VRTRRHVHARPRSHRDLLAPVGGRPASRASYFFECGRVLPSVFAGTHSDFALCETGMGGRLDSTYILLPEVTGHPAIDFGSRKFIFGHSIEEIAKKNGNHKPALAGQRRRAPYRPRGDPVSTRGQSAFPREKSKMPIFWRTYRSRLPAFPFNGDFLRFKRAHANRSAPRRRFSSRSAPALAPARFLPPNAARPSTRSPTRGFACDDVARRLERITDLPEIYVDAPHPPARANSQFSGSNSWQWTNDVI